MASDPPPSPSILVVDDTAENLRLLVSMLGNHSTWLRTRQAATPRRATR